MNDLIFEKIGFRNFMSYGNIMTEFVLDKKGTTLIVGENLDDNSSDKSNNGVGKTTIANALAYALYDQPISQDIPKDALVNDVNNKNMEVYCQFRRNSDTYLVHRTRKMKAGAAGNNVYFYKLEDGDKEDLTLDSMDATNKRIEGVLGLPFSIFKKIVIFTATEDSFLNMKTKDQTEFIEELFELTILSKKADLLKDQIKECEQKIAIIKTQIERQEKENSRYIQQVETAEKRVAEWTETNARLIHELTEKLNRLTSIDIDQQKQYYDKINTNTQIVNDLERQLDKLANEEMLVQNQFTEKINSNKQKIHEHERRIDKINTTKMQLQKQHSDKLYANNQKIEKLKFAVQKLTEDIKRLVGQIKQNNEELVHLRDAKCPRCLQKYDSEEEISRCEQLDADLLESVNQSKDKIQLLQESIADLTQENENLQTVQRTDMQPYDTEIILIKEQIGTIDQENKQTVNALQDQLKPLKQKAAGIRTTITNVNNESKELQSKIVVGSVDELTKISNECIAIRQRIDDLQRSSNPHVDALEDLKNEKPAPINYEEINTQTKLCEHHKFLHKLLVKKDSFIRKALLNKNLHFLNVKLQHYLHVLGLPHKVTFTHELVPTIVTSYGTKRGFGNLSQGQKARVNIALALAFREVLQNLHNKINLCFFDEVLDHGLDEPGVEAVAGLLKVKAKEELLSLYIISHRSEIDRKFDRTITVQMRDRFSKIIE